MRKIVITILTAAFIFLTFSAWAQQPEDNSSPADPFSSSTEWTTRSWGGGTFMIPANWKEVSKNSWGLVDDEKMQGVVFSISWEDKHLRDQAEDEEGYTVEDLGETWISQESAQGFIFETIIQENAPRIKAKAICLNQPDENGNYLVFAGAMSGVLWKDHVFIFERIFSSIRLGAIDEE